MGQQTTAAAAAASSTELDVWQALGHAEVYRFGNANFESMVRCLSFKLMSIGAIAALQKQWSS